MIVAVAAMRVVQVPVDEVVDVVAVRHRFVAAVGTVLMRVFVSGALMTGAALVRVLGADGQLVLLDAAVLAGVMHVAVV